MVGHGGSSAGSYLVDPTSPIPSHCASIVAISTVRVKEAAEGTEKMWSLNTGEKCAFLSLKGHRWSLNTGGLKGRLDYIIIDIKAEKFY